MKKMLVFILLVGLMVPTYVYAKRVHKNSDCRDAGTLVTDGTGDMRTKKRGGNYVSIPLNTLEPGQVIRVIRKSGNIKYVTLHGRYEGGIWKTIYKGQLIDFPVDKYLSSQMKDKRCTNAILSVNGGHERYEAIVCEAVVKVCADKPDKGKGDCRDAGTLKNDGTGDMRTKKRGGNYVSIPLNTLETGQVIRVIRKSGNIKYVTLHGRYEGGIWKTIYQGPITEFPVDQYLSSQKKDKRCTNVIVTVNGAHEKYEPIACEAVVNVCEKKGGGMGPQPGNDQGDCRDAGTLKTDGSGDMRSKKRGGNYASIPLNTLDSGQVIRVIRKSGTLKYVTLHGRYEGGIWKTIYQGPITEFPVDQYLSSQKKDKKCTNVIVTVNGSHEKYEPIACEAVVKVCGKKGSEPGPQASLQDLMKKESRVAIKAHNGKFVSAINGGGGEAVADKAEAKEWETFTMVPLPGKNKVAFKAKNGQFVCAEDGGGREVVVNRSWSREWETFTLIPMPGHNNVVIQTYNGKFLSVEYGKGFKVTAKPSRAMAWETFTIVGMK